MPSLPPKSNQILSLWGDEAGILRDWWKGGMGVTVGGKHQPKAEGKSGGTLRGSHSTHTEGEGSAWTGGRAGLEKEELGRQCEVGAPGVGASLTLSHRGGWLTGLGGPWKGETGRWGADATFLLIPPLLLSSSGDTQLGILAYSQGKTRPTTARRGSPRSQHPEGSPPPIPPSGAPSPEEDLPWQVTQSERDRGWQGDVPFARKS